MDKHAIHLEEGTPMIYFDQLAMIHDHLCNIKNEESSSTIPTITKLNQSSEESSKYCLRMIESYPKHGTIKAVKAILPKNKRRGRRLTRKKLKNQDDWNDWLLSERKQLDQYHAQKTFGQPCHLPVGANVLDLLWTYTLVDAVTTNNKP